MTMKEVIENELKCVRRDCCRLENECAKCDLVLPKEEIINAYNKALKLEKENAELKERADKAKDIIKGLYFIIQDRIDYENNIGIADEMWRAEQFLKEDK